MLRFSFILLLFFVRLPSGVASSIIYLPKGLLEEQSSVSLRGPWLLRSLDTLEAQSYKSIDEIRNLKPTHEVYLPHSFKKEGFGDGRGIFVFRAKIRSDSPLENYSIYIPSAVAATELWVDEEKIFESGRVGNSFESEAASRDYGYIPLPKKADFTLTLVVSNFHHANGGIRSPLMIGKTPVIMETRKLILSFISFIFGSFILVTIYHLALFLRRPEEKANTFLALFSLGSALRSLLSGNPRLASEWLGSIDYAFSLKLEYLGLVLSVIGSVGYFDTMLPGMLKRWFKNAVFLICYLMAGVSMLSSVYVFSSMLTFFQVVILITLVYGFIALGIALYRGLEGTITLALGVSLLFIVSFVEILMLMQGIVFPLYYIGAYLMVVILSFKLAADFTKRFSSLAFYKKQTHHAYSEMNKVFYPHQLSALSLGEKLEDTMPVGKGEACVICFDLIGSSSWNLDEQTRTQFTRSLFARCYALMDKNYDANKLSADAFRIKEMGDGFLCSIGYPFKNENNISNEELAASLAIKFIMILIELQHELQIENPICASIGVANGTIEAFFTRSGTLDYDLLGRPIIRATRYERARHILFEHFDKQSVICLQSKVFKMLSPELQAQFSCYTLTEFDKKIRDDDLATHFYYSLANEWRYEQIKKIS